MKTTTGQRRKALIATVIGTMLVSIGACSSQPDQAAVTVGLITKQETNPYWVTMREVAQDTADRQNVELITASGTSDVDAQSQITAIDDMINAGVDGILIAATVPDDLTEALNSAREAGITVIAVDTPVEPADAVDAFFGTDNEQAGRLIGEYAAGAARDLGLTPKIALLNLAPDIASGELRRTGFLEGFGVTEDDESVVAEIDTQGDRELGESAMAQILAQTPDVNVIYTVNEQAALGALTALRAANVDLGQVVLVSVDGGCEAMKGPVRDGDIDATATQFPQNMAIEGVSAIADQVRGGQAPSGYLGTGTELVTDAPVGGVDSKNVAYGVRNCWG